MTQITLFERRTLQSRFEKYDTENPHVRLKIIELARQVKRRGYDKYSIAGLFERLRWHYLFEVETEEEFKLSNDFRSRYARLIMDTEPDLAGFFDTRELRTA